ncbi:MAG: hypothetical protein AMXMBFR33_37810 [Candidatus Xenobia bacterium]
MPLDQVLLLNSSMVVNQLLHETGGETAAEDQPAQARQEYERRTLHADRVAVNPPLWQPKQGSFM